MMSVVHSAHARVATHDHGEPHPVSPLVALALALVLVRQDTAEGNNHGTYILGVK